MPGSAGRVRPTGQVLETGTELVLLRKDVVRPARAVRRQLHGHGVGRAEEPRRIHELAQRDRGELHTTSRAVGRSSTPRNVVLFKKMRFIGHTIACVRGEVRPT